MEMLSPARLATTPGKPQYIELRAVPMITVAPVSQLGIRRVRTSVVQQSTMKRRVVARIEDDTSGPGGLAELSRQLIALPLALGLVSILAVQLNQSADVTDARPVWALTQSVLTLPAIANDMRPVPTAITAKAIPYSARSWPLSHPSRALHNSRIHPPIQVMTRNRTTGAEGMPQRSGSGSP